MLSLDYMCLRCKVSVLYLALVLILLPVKTGQAQAASDSLLTVAIYRPAAWFISDVGETPSALPTNSRIHNRLQEIPNDLDENRALIVGIIGFVVFQSLIILVLGFNLRNINITEKELRLSEERWQFALDGSGDGVWDWDFRINRITYNPRYIEMLGYQVGEFTDSVEEWSSRLHPEDRDRAMADLDKHIKGETPSTVVEFRMLAKDGSYRWILGRGKIIARADDGTPLRMVGTHTDITRWKWAEEKIRQINTTLENRVGERTAQLEAANRELEAFSFSVSHDLRAPLRGIDGLSQVMIEDYGKLLPEDGIECLNSIRESSQRMADLIDDLLSLAHVNRSEIQTVPVNLGNLARPIVEKLMAQDPSRDVTWVIPDDLTVSADSHLTNILLTNLLANAWKFTTHHPTARIEMGSLKQEGQQVFFVRDDGAGFDMANADKLFSAFQRLHSASQFEGTGIGLATVQRIVDRHGGQVWAESAPEQGATVYFTLPQ